MGEALRCYSSITQRHVSKYLAKIKNLKNEKTGLFEQYTNQYSTNRIKKRPTQR